MAKWSLVPIKLVQHVMALILKASGGQPLTLPLLQMSCTCTTELLNCSITVLICAVSFRNMATSDQLSIISDVFHKFSGVAQIVSRAAAPLVPGLFIVAVAFKALDKVVQQNANADVCPSDTL